MKINIQCMLCTIEQVRDNGSDVASTWYPLELSDTNLYLVECEKGHKFAVRHDALRFEILVDSGLWAFALGMQDSAYLKFYAALEDFRIFFVRMWLRSQLEEREQCQSILDSLKRSEPQGGAFLLAFGFVSQQHPEGAPKLPNMQNLTELRNKIAHTGYIPTPEEAKQKSQYILDFLVDLIIWSKKILGFSIHEAAIDIALLQTEALNKSGYQGKVSTVSIPSILSTSQEPLQKISIDDAIAKVSNNPFFVRPW